MTKDFTQLSLLFKLYLFTLRQRISISKQGLGKKNGTVSLLLQETHQDSERELSLRRHCTRTKNTIDGWVGASNMASMRRVSYHWMTSSLQINS